MYKPANINFTKSQIEKALSGKPIRLSGNQIGSGANVFLFHPANYKLLEKSAKSGKGCCVSLSPGEFNATLESDIEGSGFIDWIKNKALPWLKKNAPILKPIASAVADAGASMLGTKGQVARQALKQITGIGNEMNMEMKPKKTKKKRSIGQGLYLAKPTGNGLYL